MCEPKVLCQRTTEFSLVAGTVGKRPAENLVEPETVNIIGVESTICNCYPDISALFDWPVVDWDGEGGDV